MPEEKKKEMIENLEKYGTDDPWHLEQYKDAEQVFDAWFKDRKTNTVHDIYQIVSDLMIKHGPDGHCDGSQIIALILWKLLKK